MFHFRWISQPLTFAYYLIWKWRVALFFFEEKGSGSENVKQSMLKCAVQCEAGISFCWILHYWMTMGWLCSQIHFFCKTFFFWRGFLWLIFFFFWWQCPVLANCLPSPPPPNPCKKCEEKFLKYEPLTLGAWQPQRAPKGNSRKRPRGSQDNASSSTSAN